MAEVCFLIDRQRHAGNTKAKGNRRQTTKVVAQKALVKAPPKERRVAANQTFLSAHNKIVEATS